MKDFDRLIARFWEFGGWRLVWQYVKMGVLWVAVKELIRCALTGRSVKMVYPKVTKLFDEKLIKKYDTQSEIAAPACWLSQSEATERTIREQSSLRYGASAYDNSIWFCWLQGIENAPELVKKCLESQREAFGEEVTVLDESSYTDYVTLPDYIVEKRKKGYIPSALFSDMIRLELLIRYGGTWIDATVFASPKIKEDGSRCQKIWQKIRESELFIYRYFDKQGRVVGLSNWFIHAKEPGNPLLIEVRDSLYAYWKEYDCVVEYYIFHLFFGKAAKHHPEMIQKMPRGNSYHAIWLGEHANIGNETWEQLMTNVPFHKLNWRKQTAFPSTKR